MEGIGGSLGVKETDLDSYQMQEGNKPDANQHCMRCVFQNWHSAMTSEYSWKNVVQVLESPAVNKKAAVQELYESLCTQKKLTVYFLCYCMLTGYSCA